MCGDPACPGFGTRADRLEIGEPRGAPDEIDLAPDRTRGKIDRIIEDQTAARVHFAVAQIERLGQTNRADEIRCAPEKFRIDCGAGDLDMAFVQDEPNLILFRNLSGQIEAKARFEFRVAIVIKSERGQLGLETKVRIEKIGIFPKNFTFVAALVPFGRSRERPAISEKISVTKTRAHDRARIRAVAEGETELLAFRFLGGDVEPQRVAADRRRFDLKDVEQAGPHQFAEFFVDQIGAVGFAAEFAEPAGKIARSQPIETLHRHAIEMIKPPGRNRHQHRHLAIARRGWIADRVHLHFVIAARPVVGLQPARDIRNASCRCKAARPGRAFGRAKPRVRRWFGPAKVSSPKKYCRPSVIGIVASTCEPSSA